jgi:inner membrane protein
VDNLTHTLVGAALSKSGVERITPLATATLVVAANAPDVDVLSHAHSQWFALSFRRGLTHGIPALIVLPWVVAGMMAVWDTRVRRRRHPALPPTRFSVLLLISYVGVLTHPVLDWMNTYGMRWWLPFDGRWSYGDSLFIIDPWLWLLLGVAVALAWPRSRLGSVGWLAVAGVTTTLILRTPFVPGPGKVAWVALVLMAALARTLGKPTAPEGGTRLCRGLTAAAAGYVALMVISHRAAVVDVRGALGQAGIVNAQAIMIGPRPADPIGSEALVRTDNLYVRGSHDWTDSPRAQLTRDSGFPQLDVAPGVSVVAAGAAVAAARTQPEVARYLVWSRFPYWRVETADGGLRVRVGDARFPGTGGLAGLSVMIPIPTRSTQ